MRYYRIFVSINFFRLFIYTVIIVVLYLLINFIDIYLHCEYGWKNYYYNLFSPAKKNFEKGYLLFRNGELASASDEFKIAVQKDDRLFAGWFFLGKIYHERGDNKQAIFYLRKAKEIDRSVEKLYTLLANIYLEEDMIDDAISTLLEAKKNIFPSSEILYLLGYSYERANEISRAVEVYDSCITKFYPRDEFGRMCDGRDKIIKKKYFDR